MVAVEIPEVLRKEEFRFVLLSPKSKNAFEKEWQKIGYACSDSHLTEHLSKGGNYGVLCGVNGLIVIDCDKPEPTSIVKEFLPETLTIKTGSGKFHFYYICKELEKKIVLNNGKEHYGEVQAKGAYVVGPNSIHPDGNPYVILEEKPIAEISLEDLLVCIKPFIKEVSDSEDVAAKETDSYFDLVSAPLSILKAIDTSKFRKASKGELCGSNPWHGSTNGQNTFVNPKKNVAYCFRCCAGIDTLKAIALNEKIILTCSDVLKGESFVKTLKIAVEKYGLKMERQEVSKTDNEIEIEGVGKFLIKELVKLKNILLVYEQSALGSVSEYNIHRFYFGIGQYPYYLISIPPDRVNNGTEFLSIKFANSELLRKLPKPQSVFIKRISKERAVEEASNELLWETIIRQQDILPYFFTKTAPLYPTSIALLRTLTSSQLNKLLDFYLTENNEIDERLKLVAKINLFKYIAKEPTVSNFIMPLNPHSLIQTNTKTAKSTLFSKVGQKRERMSLAGVLGFSTGNETNIGDIDGVMGAYTIDEVQEEKKENIIRQALTLMETGTSSVSVGKQVVHTNCCATLNFCTNPKELQAEGVSNVKTVNLSSFERMLQILTDNYRAFGSRIGLILFGSNFKEARGQRYDSSDYLKIKFLVEYLVDSIAPKFTEISLDKSVQDWVNAELPADYEHKVKKTCERITSKPVREFWLGHLGAHRHIRGAALRSACLYYISEIFSNQCDLQKILKKANESLPEILECNLTSLEKMAVIDQSYKATLSQSVITTCEPDYLRYLVLTLLRYFDKNPLLVNSFVILDELRSVFEEISRRFDSTKYSRWNELKGKFDRPRPSIGTKLFTDFGVVVQNIDGKTGFSIENVEKFKDFLKTSNYMELVNKKEGVNGVIGVNGTQKGET